MYDVILGRRSSAIPGDLTRPNTPFEVVGKAALAGNPPTIFGNAVAVDATTGHIRPIGAGDTVANVFGALVRVFPTQSTTYPNPDFSTQGAPNPYDILSVLKEGYIAVQVSGATAPVAGGAVYIQTVAATGIAVGAYSAVSSASNFQLTGAEFTGGVDANGFGEIRFRIV